MNLPQQRGTARVYLSASAPQEAAQAAGQMLSIRVLGLASIAQDVTPELARATITSVEVLGAFHASHAVKAALRDRIR